VNSVVLQKIESAEECHMTEDSTYTFQAFTHIERLQIVLIQLN